MGRPAQRADIRGRIEPETRTQNRASRSRFRFDSTACVAKRRPSTSNAPPWLCDSVAIFFFVLSCFRGFAMNLVESEHPMRMCRALILAAACLGVSLSAQVPVRTRPPSPGPAPVLKLPALQKRQLANGLPVWMVELHEVPVAQVNLVVLNGAASDPSGKFGVTNLMTAMLE